MRYHEHDLYRSASVVKLLIALDYLESHGPDYQIPPVDLAQLQPMLRSSDRHAASYFWIQDGWETIVQRMIAKIDLTDTASPASRGRWGTPRSAPRTWLRSAAISSTPRIRSTATPAATALAAYAADLLEASSAPGHSGLPWSVPSGGRPAGGSLVLVGQSGLRWTMAGIGVSVIVLGVAVACLVAWRIYRPVRQVASAASKLGNGDFTVRVPIKGRDDLAALATAFNTMAQRLEDSIEELRAKDVQQQRFTADVAHDLRTPIAALVALADNLGNSDPGKAARAGELVGGQARRLAKLVEDLLEIARFDSGRVGLQPEPVKLDTLVAEAIALGPPDAGVEVESAGDLNVVADPRRVYSVVSNLLSNAVTHGAPPITVTLDGTGADVTARVADSGPGVSADLIPVVFDRFVRGDEARGTAGGSGLGLAIARENVLVHGATLTVHNDHGAVFQLTLPRGCPTAVES